MAQLDEVAVLGAVRPGRGSAAFSTNAVAILSVFGAAHLVVDAISAAVVVSIVSTSPAGPKALVGLVLLYHVLAFGLQAMIGLAVDALGTPRWAAVCGCLVTACALLVPSSPMLAMILAGVGNAAFHVGGGAISLRLAPHRATAPGLFVAPGSLGLLLGVILCRSLPTAMVVLLPVAAVACLLMIWIPIPAILLVPPVPSSSQAAGRSGLILGLVLIAIAIRALLGFLVESPWETHPILLVQLTLATVLGKALGGIVADRWGWLRGGVGATLAALPFLAWSSVAPAAAIPGLLLLNLTMPVTLAAVAKAVPHYPGFAFGLASLAFLLGAIPSLLGLRATDPGFICLAILLSAVVLYRALSWLPFSRSLQTSNPGVV